MQWKVQERKTDKARRPTSTINNKNKTPDMQNRTAAMTDSKIIEVNGIFLGTAVSRSDRPGWQVVAANARVVPADGQTAATWQEASALARRAYWAADLRAA
jgi:hypothetical protein